MNISAKAKSIILFNSTIAVCLCILIQEYLILIYLKYSYVHSDYASRLDYCTVAISMGDSQTITILSFIFFIFFDDAMNDK